MGPPVMTETTESAARAASEQRHRLANTLQLLSALARMRGQRVGDPESRRQLLWMADAIGSIGALEQKRGANGVDFAAYLIDMAPVWRRRHGPRQAQVVVEADPLTANDQTASTLSLIVQELVGNALLHGFADDRAGQVTIRLRRTGDLYILSVDDNGAGFDPAAPECCERFGLWLVRSLAPQVRGQFTLEHGPGVTAALSFSSEDRAS